jgi:hypothetical protein
MNGLVGRSLDTGRKLSVFCMFAGNVVIGVGSSGGTGRRRRWAVWLDPGVLHALESHLIQRILC